MALFRIFSLVYAFSHIYLFICLRRAFGGGKWQIPVILWLLFMAVAWVWRLGRRMGSFSAVVQDITHIWMGLFILLCYCLLAADLLALAARALAFAGRTDMLRRAAAFMVAPRHVPAAVALALVLYAWGVWQAHHPGVRELRLTSSKLPPGSPPLRIAGLTDVHLSSLIGPRMLRPLAAQVAELKPDILLMGGDLVDVPMDGRDEDAAILRSIPAPLGRFAVLGNHEYYRGEDMSLRFTEEAGFTVLRGEFAEAGGIVVAGVDDEAFAGRFEPDTADVELALDGIPEDRFVLLLKHRPERVSAAAGRFDLQYSGHTHGGQFWPGPWITKRIYGHPQGLSEVTGGRGLSLLYISNGTGYWGPPMRLGPPPEITLIVLEPERAEGSAAP